MNSDQIRKLVLLLIAMTVVVLVGALDGSRFAPMEDAEWYLQDWRVRLGRMAPRDDRLVLIGIDRPSYEDLITAEEGAADPALGQLRGRFPWSRALWATLIEQLTSAGANIVAIDLLFAGPGDGDDNLRAALERHAGKVVIGANFTESETDRGTLRQLTTPHPQIIAASANGSSAFDVRVGYVNVWADRDGVLRRAVFRVTNADSGDTLNAPSDAILESLAMRTLRGAGELDKVPEQRDPVRFRFSGPPGSFRLHSVADVLTPKLWKANYGDGEFFRGKIVLIGPTANIFQDRHRVPFGGEMLGPEVHLNIINAALSGEFVREPNRAVAFCFLVGAGLFAVLLIWLLPQPVWRIVGLTAVSGFYLWMGQVSFNRSGWMMPMLGPLLVLNLSGAAALAYDFVLERIERLKLRHTMSLYFSPRVMDAVLADPGSMQPRRAEVTLLLTDLRNSTPLAEALGPRGMFDLLNRVFEIQTGAIMSEDGNLEHFLGDQFLSYWGAPQPQPDGADRAERAAVKLITAMEALRDTLPPEVRQQFGYGVALHSGSVLVGNKGSALRLDYGLVGDAVNEAARIESLTKFYRVKLLISRQTFSQFSEQGERRLIDRVIVKGKSTPVELYEGENPCVHPRFKEVCAAYKAAYDEYFFGRFAVAAQLFASVANEFEDGPSQVLAERCAHLIRNPPSDWIGVWNLESK